MAKDLLCELQELREEVNSLNKKLDSVTLKVIQSLDVGNDGVSEPESKPKLEKGVQVESESIPAPIPKPIPKPTPQIVSEPIVSISKQTKKSKIKQNDLESKIGKNLMGILASILIFIGLASFVAFVFTDLSEVVKFGLMYLFSFGLFGVGLWCVNKNRNGFSLSLAGCGIGAVFISILLSYFYFEFVSSQLLLFGLLVGWSVVGLILSKKYKSDLFVIISYIGFYIAIALGAFSGIALFNEEICTVAIMVILHSIFTYFVASRKVLTSKKLYTIFPFLSLFGSFILVVYVLCLNWHSLSIFEFHSILLTLSMLIQMGVNLYYVFKLKQFKFSEFLVIVVFILTCIVNILGMLSTSLDYYVPIEEGKNNQFLSFLFVEDIDYSFSTKDDISQLSCITYEESIGLLKEDDYIGLTILFAALVHILFIEWSRKKLRLQEDGSYNILRYIGLFGLSIFSALVVCIDPMNEYLVALFGLVIPASVLLRYGQEDKQFFKLSQIVYLIGLIVGCYQYQIAFLKEHFWAFIVFAIFNVIYLISSGIVLKKNYKLSNKVWYYLIGIFNIFSITYYFTEYFSIVTADMYRVFYEKSLEGSIFCQASTLYNELPIWQFLKYYLAPFINFVVITIVSLFIKLSNFCQNWDNVVGLKKFRDEKLDIVYHLNNVLIFILLLLGIGLIHNIEVVPILFICILLSSLLCFIGSRELLNRDKRILEYYVCIKATLFINIVMAAFIDSGLGYIYSIVCLLIAIISIIIGFAKELKSFRLYGLILSLCSVLKLVMIDISYDNSLGRVFSFIGAGLLCFGIVWIYNKMSEKLKE